MSYTNTRSQPIAIKHTTQHLELELDDEREEHEKQMYESATFRMYNRIVNQRLNSPPHQSAAPIHQNNNGSPSSLGGLVHSQASPSPTTGLVRPRPRYAQPMIPIMPQPRYAQPMMPSYEHSFSNMNMYPSSSDFDEEEVFDFEL